jgi:hypothetical protein
MHTIPYKEMERKCIPYHTIPFPLPMHTIQWKIKGYHFHFQCIPLPLPMHTISNAYHTMARQCIPFPLPMHTIPYHFQCIPYKAMARQCIPYHTISIDIANVNTYHTIPLSMHTIQWQRNAYHTIPYHTRKWKGKAYHTIPLSMHSIHGNGKAMHTIPYKAGHGMACRHRNDVLNILGLDVLNILWFLCVIFFFSKHLLSKP